MLILPAVLTRSINMDISVQTEVVTVYEKLKKKIQTSKLSAKSWDLQGVEQITMSCPGYDNV